MNARSEGERRPILEIHHALEPESDADLAGVRRAFASLMNRAAEGLFGMGMDLDGAVLERSVTIKTHGNSIETSASFEALASDHVLLHAIQNGEARMTRLTIRAYPCPDFPARPSRPERP